MQSLKKYAPFFFAAIFMCTLLYAIYPYYQYYIDPDGTAYLTISKRYAAGDYAKAINGYWSPWSCWLTAILIKQGIAAITASVIINALGAIGFLYISHSFFVKFGISRQLQWMLVFTLAFFLPYALFWQSFDDLWECFFLLCVLRLILVAGYDAKPGLWVLTGVIGALAYFAKAYAFPYFIFSFIVCSFFISGKSRRRWPGMCAVAIGVMIVCSLPWIWLLHHKYGSWITSTAGALNMSWYLVGHPLWKEGITYLVPPAYPDSPYYWEDTYFATAATPHFWDSFQLLGMQVLRTGYNMLKFVLSVLQISFFFPFLLFVAVRILRSQKMQTSFPKQTRTLVVSFLLFPVGFFLINFEPRYLWYMLPLSMVLGGLAIQNKVIALYRPLPPNIAAVGNRERSATTFLLVLFALSYLIFPVLGYQKMFREGVNEYKVAEQLKGHITGSFTADATPGIMAQRAERLAYFSGLQYYYPLHQPIPVKELLAEMRKYHINYYFSYNRASLMDEQGIPFPVAAAFPGLVIYRVNQ